MTELVVSAPHRGPVDVLGLVVAAQAASAAALSAGEIKRTADSLVRHALALGDPVLAAVSPMAQRLVGAAMLASDGTLRATDESSVPVGEHVLLVEVVAVAPGALSWNRNLFERLGAARLSAVAVDLLRDRDPDVHLLRR